MQCVCLIRENTPHPFYRMQGESMIETCMICGQTEAAGELGAWFHEAGRSTVHMECWIAYRNAREAVNLSAAGAITP